MKTHSITINGETIVFTIKLITGTEVISDMNLSRLPPKKYNQSLLFKLYDYCKAEGIVELKQNTVVMVSPLPFPQV